MDTFHNMTMREIDEAIRNTSTAELDARMAEITDAQRSLERAVLASQPDGEGE